MEPLQCKFLGDLSNEPANQCSVGGSVDWLAANVASFFILANLIPSFSSMQWCPIKLGI